MIFWVLIDAEQWEGQPTEIFSLTIQIHPHLSQLTIAQLFI